MGAVDVIHVMETYYRGDFRAAGPGRPLTS
jgi:hypothetical protein